MGLETGTFVSDLVSANPPGTDPKNQGDDHLRLIKSLLQATFPNADKTFYFPGVQAKNADYTVVTADENDLFVVDASGGVVTITLPTSPATGYIVSVSKDDSSGNAVTVDGGGAETINGALTSVLTARYQLETYQFDGTEWKIVGAGTDSLANILEDTTPQLGGALDTNAFAINESEGSVASATTTNIWLTTANTVHITGTTTITSFATAPRVGAWRKVIFDGILTLTDGANLNLPGGANITTAADDFAFVYAETTTLFKVLYFKADGTAVVGGAVAATQAEMETGTDVTVMVTPGRQQFHESAIKGWVNFDEAAAVDSSFNVSSITDTGVGNWTVNWLTDFSSALYVVVTASDASGANPPDDFGPVLAGRAAASIQVKNLRAGSVSDGTLGKTKYVAGLGDQ